MSNPYVGEIRIAPFNFAPTGWALCNGQLMPISQNTALFSLLGTFYGGDGISTFGLPNFQGRAPVCMGQGPGLSQYVIGEILGEQYVTLLQSEMPAHNHLIPASTAGGNVDSPNNALWATPHTGKTGIAAYTMNTTSNATMNTAALSNMGGNLPHNNLSPYLVLTFIIALQGVFPPRS